MLSIFREKTHYYVCLFHMLKIPLFSFVSQVARTAQQMKNLENDMVCYGGLATISFVSVFLLLLSWISPLYAEFLSPSLKLCSCQSIFSIPSFLYLLGWYLVVWCTHAWGYQWKIFSLVPFEGNSKTIPPAITQFEILGETLKLWLPRTCFISQNQNL